MDELLQLIEDQFGYNVSITKKPSDEELTKRVAKAIQSNEDVLEQLRKAKMDREAGISDFIDDEDEFSRLSDEVNGGRK